MLFVSVGFLNCAKTSDELAPVCSKVAMLVEAPSKSARRTLLPLPVIAEWLSCDAENDVDGRTTERTR